MNYKHYYVKDGLAVEEPGPNEPLPTDKYSNFRFSTYRNDEGVKTIKTHHFKFTLVHGDTTHYFYLEDQFLTDYWEKVMENEYIENLNKER